MRAAYQSTLWDLQRQKNEGFGQWGFLDLPGVPLGGEAREVHNAFLDEWNFKDRHNNRRARRAEHNRALWRSHRRERTAFQAFCARHER